jgi:hypothetical protein
MKKQILKISATAILLALYSITSAVYVTPIRTMVIPNANYVPVMDGSGDEAWWSASQTTDAFNKTGCADYPSADFTFSFKVAFDSKFFYVLGTFMDDIDNSTQDNGATNPWTFDNAEIFLDLDTSGSGMITAYDSNTIQLRVNRGMDSVQTTGRATRADFKLYWENTADGWMFEVAIPWKAVLATSEETSDIRPFLNNMASGFDVSGADSDAAPGTPDMRDCQAAWDSDDPSDSTDRTEDNAWNNRSVFGVVFVHCFEIGCDGDPCLYNPAGCWHPNSVKNNINDEWIVFPNPAENTLSIEQISIGDQIDITNIFGQQLLSVTATSEKTDLDISGLPKGNMYILKTTDKDGNSLTAKFVKE